MFWRPFFLAALMLALAPASWAAQVYQWTDADGVKHYTNQPPPDSVAVESVEKEIAPDPEAERLKAEKDAALLLEIDEKNRQEAAGAAFEAGQDAARKALEEKQAELDAAGEKVLNKRKYIGRHGRQDINAYDRLDKEINALKNDPNADPQTIQRLEAERDAVKEKIYTTPRRTRKGVGQDIENYQELEKEVNALKETIPPKEQAAE
ncbi:MAG: DUF4124 domain-containing protein [Pseudomonadota bacterium]